MPSFGNRFTTTSGSQHPEWVEPNGESPKCDFYEARLMEELDTFTRGIRRVHRRALEQGVKVVKTQPTAERNPQGLLPKVPPGLEAQVEGAFRKLCEALSLAERTSEALGGWAHRDPDRLAVD
jgi:hypothetical protein